ncbi:MAG: MerC domain-containing protein [Myxococcota bacterium]
MAGAPSPDPSSTRPTPDPIGIAASGLCAVHCVICAALPGVLGLLGLEVLLGPRVEWGFTIVAIIFASLSLGYGWRHHRSPWIAAALLLGMLGLLTARVLEEDHAAPDEHADHASHDDHAGDDAAPQSHRHDGDHVFGAWLGALSGLVLVGGHLWTIRASRRNARCCD